jgi:phage terminase Nu1 subunit (DNA packaging protein)
LNAEAAALKRATRELVELRRDALARKLISREDITDAWGAIVRTIRAMVLSIPGRCQVALPHLKFEDFETFRTVVRAVLTEAATIMPAGADSRRAGCLYSRAAQARSSAGTEHVAPSLI